MKFSGIDLHSNNSVVLISDEADRTVYQKRLPNDLAQILGALEPYWLTREETKIPLSKWFLARNNARPACVAAPGAAG